MTCGLNLQGWIAIGLSALALSGCATPPPAVYRQGEIPARPAAEFGFYAGDPIYQTPSQLTSALGRRLEQAGLTWSKDSHARFRVEAAYSVRESSMGAYQTTTGRNEPVWIASPASRRWWSSNRHGETRELAVRITDTRSGVDVYRASVVERNRPHRPVVWDRLASAAIEEPPPGRGR